MTTTVHMFSDYACPWCYLGRARLKAAVADQDVAVETLHFPLSPDTPAEGRAIRPYLESKGIPVDAAVTRLRDLLSAEGLPYLGDPDRMRAWPTRKAHELAAWAVEQPGGHAIHDALFHAYHVDNVNVGDVEVLVGIAAQVGLDADAARAVLTDGRAAGLVDAHYALAKRAGVSAVPTFVADRKGLVGAREVGELRALIGSAAG